MGKHPRGRAQEDQLPCRASVSTDPRPRTRPLRPPGSARLARFVALCVVPSSHWCHGCGDRVAELGFDDLCPLCEEVDARLDAHLGSAARDLAERLIELSLDYLNPQDVRAVLDECVAERTGSPAPLDELFERSFHYVDARAQRANTRVQSEAPMGSIEQESFTCGAVWRRLRRR